MIELPEVQQYIQGKDDDHEIAEITQLTITVADYNDLVHAHQVSGGVGILEHILLMINDIIQE